MNDATSEQKTTFGNKQFLKVSFLFLSLVIILDLLVWYLSQAEYLVFLQTSTSDVITNLIRVSGLQVVQNGNFIYLKNSSWFVSMACTAVYIMVIFAAFVLVYSASLKEKGIALGLGIPFIFGANITRLYCMAWIDFLKPQYSNLFHDYMWQVAFIVMVIFLWIIWIEKVIKRESKDSVSA